MLRALLGARHICGAVAGAPTPRTGGTWVAWGSKGPLVEWPATQRGGARDAVRDTHTLASPTLCDKAPLMCSGRGYSMTSAFTAAAIMAGSTSEPLAKDTPGGQWQGHTREPSEAGWCQQQTWWESQEVPNAPPKLPPPAHHSQPLRACGQQKDTTPSTLASAEIPMAGGGGRRGGRMAEQDLGMLPRITYQRDTTTPCLFSKNFSKFH